MVSAVFHSPLDAAPVPPPAQRQRAGAPTPAATRAKPRSAAAQCRRAGAQPFDWRGLVAAGAAAGRSASRCWSASGRC